MRHNTKPGKTLYLKSVGPVRNHSRMVRQTDTQASWVYPDLCVCEQGDSYSSRAVLQRKSQEGRLKGTQKPGEGHAEWVNEGNLAREHRQYLCSRSQQTFSVKSQIVNILGISGHMVSVVSAHLYPYSVKAAIG